MIFRNDYCFDLQQITIVLTVGSSSIDRRLTVEIGFWTVNRRYTEPIPTVNTIFLIIKIENRFPYFVLLTK